MVEPKETKMEEKSEEITKDDTKKKNSPEEQLKEMTDTIETKEKAEDEKSRRGVYDML